MPAGPRYSPNSPQIGRPAQSLLARPSHFLWDPSTGSNGASATANIAQMLMSGTSAAVTLADSTGYGPAFTCTSSTTNPLTLQANGEPFKVTANTGIHFQAHVALTDADGMSFFAGLAITDTTPWTTSLTDYIGFFAVNQYALQIGAGMNNDAVPGSGTTGETDQAADTTVTASTMVDATFVQLDFITHGTTKVVYYVNGQNVGTITTNLPTDEDLTPTLAFVGTGEVVTCKLMSCVGDRP